MRSNQDHLRWFTYSGRITLANDVGYIGDLTGQWIYTTQVLRLTMLVVTHNVIVEPLYVYQKSGETSQATCTNLMKNYLLI
jgi:hypothetical protein